jgi:hypothetical protein
MTTNVIKNPWVDVFVATSFAHAPRFWDRDNRLLVLVELCVQSSDEGGVNNGFVVTYRAHLLHSHYRLRIQAEFFGGWLLGSVGIGCGLVAMVCRMHNGS